MSDVMMYATVGAAALDAALSAGLLAVYGRSYARIKAPFTLGLMMFAGLFLVQNALAAYSYLSLMTFFPEPVQPFMLAVMALEAVALSVILYSSNK